MEYSADGSSYTPCSGTKITGLSAGTYSVRYKETATHEASAAATVSVPAYGAPAPGTVATPTFSPAGGTFTSAQNVTISCAMDGTTIHYTTDGTTPTESSPTYSAPISVSATTTIKAIAVKSGWTNSAVASATFTLKSSGNGGSGGGSTGGSSGGSSAPATPSSTTTNGDGSTTTTTTNSDGSKTAVTTAQDGSTTTMTTAKDGSATTTEKAADGSTGTVKTDAQGNTVSAEAAPSAQAISEAVAKGEAVTLPVAVKATSDAASAAPVSVTLPAGSENVTVEIPVENLTAGTVAVIVHADGTEEIVKTSTTSEDGVVLTLDGSATVKIVDNTKSFGDVTGGEWYADSVAWAASHEVMNGMGDGDFSPDAEASRAQIAQLLFNLDGATADGNLASFGDVNAGDWYADAVTWMVENGIASGMGDDFGANEDVTREQLAVMLYNYARYKGYDTTMSGSIADFPDAGDADGYARSALAWAVGVGLINGTTDEDGNIVLDPQGSATRGQIAAIIERFCEKVAR